MLGPFLAHFLSALVANHCAVVACRLCMQTIGFSIPLALAAPMYVVVVVILKETNATLLQTEIGFEMIGDSYVYVYFLYAPL